MKISDKLSRLTSNLKFKTIKSGWLFGNRSDGYREVEQLSDDKEIDFFTRCVWAILILEGKNI